MIFNSGIKFNDKPLIFGPCIVETKLFLNLSRHNQYRIIQDGGCAIFIYLITPSWIIRYWLCLGRFRNSLISTVCGPKMRGLSLNVIPKLKITEILRILQYFVNILCWYMYFDIFDIRNELSVSVLVILEVLHPYVWQTKITYFFLKEGGRCHLKCQNIACVSTDFKMVRPKLYMCQKWDSYH